MLIDLFIVYCFKIIAIILINQAILDSNLLMHLQVNYFIIIQILKEINQNYEDIMITIIEVSII